ncbi:hypothetical protein [Planomonospora venezuelensis]|uniref:Uncharacterized protein n=1 Tax=Planomonospora venezuelensis TaxID=1999 RepID=A0A841DBI7_PLAVE|nr:hypothetical protein [Planomonospora venezuelensis]
MTHQRHRCFAGGTSAGAVLDGDVEDPGDAETVLEHAVERGPAGRAEVLDDGGVIGQALPVGGDLVGVLAADGDEERPVAGVGERDEVAAEDGLVELQRRAGVVLEVQRYLAKNPGRSRPGGIASLSSTGRWSGRL